MYWMSDANNGTFYLDENSVGWWEEVSAADRGPTEERAHHLPRQPEEAVQAVQGENQRGACLAHPN